MFVIILTKCSDVGKFEGSGKSGSEGLGQGRSDGGGVTGISVYIPPKSVYLKLFYVVVLSP